jgi:hypothetical protein
MSRSSDTISGKTVARTASVQSDHAAMPFPKIASSPSESMWCTRSRGRTAPRRRWIDQFLETM